VYRVGISFLLAHSMRWGEFLFIVYQRFFFIVAGRVSNGSSRNF